MKATKKSNYSIVIRKRNGFEIADLSLRILRDQWKPILFFYLPLMIPFNILNFIFSWPLLNYQTSLFESFFKWNIENMFFLLLMLFLVFIVEFHFVGSLLITYLGHWFFEGKTFSYRNIYLEWFRAIPQLSFYTLLFSIFYYRYEYLTEIILLEKTKFFRNSNNNLTTSKRAKYFHKGLSSDIFQQNLFGGISLVPTFFISLLFCYYWGMSIFANADLWKTIYIFVVLPLHCWGYTLFLTINNFLNYINLRITQEGWDLDILFKNECFRLDHQNDLFLYRAKEQVPLNENAPVSPENQFDHYSSADDIAIRALVLDRNKQKQIVLTPKVEPTIESSLILRTENEIIENKEAQNEVNQ
ncbi:MAG: hypothetical protein Q4C95_05195 [Planctomycetia bacterium]|nr:hypothetical protein [Planctomycetia bacterium]